MLLFSSFNSSCCRFTAKAFSFKKKADPHLMHQDDTVRGFFVKHINKWFSFLRGICRIHTEIGLWGVFLFSFEPWAGFSNVEECRCTCTNSHAWLWKADLKHGAGEWVMWETEVKLQCSAKYIKRTESREMPIYQALAEVKGMTDN